MTTFDRKCNEINLNEIEANRMTRSFMPWHPASKDSKVRDRKRSNSAMRSLIKGERDGTTSKARLSQALTACPIKSKEQEQEEFKELLEMKDQVFKAKCLMDAFFKKRVITKIRRYESYLESLKKLEESYGEESEGDSGLPTLIHTKRVEKSNLEKLYTKYQNIFNPTH